MGVPAGVPVGVPVATLEAHMVEGALVESWDSQMVNLGVLEVRVAREGRGFPDSADA